MVKASEVRDWVAKLLFGDVSLEEFEDWFVPATGTSIKPAIARLKA
jgi:hypothetical protein